MNPGTVYGRRQHQGRRPARTPAQQRLARRVGCGIVLAAAAAVCFGGGMLAMAVSWLLGWYQR